MQRKVKFITDLLDGPAGKRIGTLQKGDNVTETGNSKQSFVEVKTEKAIVGWVDEGDLHPAGGADREPIVEGLFVDRCLAIEIETNAQESTAPWFVSADFLIARALMMTGLKNVGPKNPRSDAVGPLQVSTEEWEAFLKDGGPLATGARPGDNDHPFKQIRGAAFRMRSDAIAISQAVTDALRAAGRPSEEPYQPNSIDLILVVVLGLERGLRFITNRVVDGGQALLTQVFDKPDADREAAIAAYPALFGLPGGKPLTLANIYDDIGQLLDKALEDTAALIKTNAPEDAIKPVESEGADPQDVPIPTEALDWSSATDKQPTVTEKMRAIYAAFRRAGFSDAGARALLAEVGRENDYRPSPLFGTHVDPANKAINAGMISWQGSRATALMKSLEARGVVGGGKIQKSQDALDAQAEFVRQEMQAMTPDIAKYLTDADQNVDYELAAKRLGVEYIKWRFKDPALASHHQKRRGYLDLSFSIITGPGPAAITEVGTAAGIKVIKAADGFHHADGLIYELKGKTRDKPVSRKFVTQLMSVVAETDPKLAVKIVSAGQDPIGTPGGRRTGSTRHDIDKTTREGPTADLVLIRDGRAVLPHDDRGVYEKLLENAAASGFPGIGHYSWGVHIGGGSVAAWGPTKSSASLDPRFAAAIAKGRARSKT